MGLLKSYDQFLNENLYGQYSYYGAGSIFPIVHKLASEGKNPQQIYLYLTTLGVDEERKRRVISKVFLNESLDFNKYQSIYENGLYEEDVETVLKADVGDLAKGVDPAEAKPDEDVKKALDKLKSGDIEKVEDESDEDESEDESEEESEDESEDDGDVESTKIKALQSALKDAKKLEKIKKILSESMGFNIDGLEDEVLESILEYHKIEEKLSDEERKKLKDSDFIFPSRRAWPIHDEKHAKTALVWATWPKYKNIKKDIVDAVLKKYPQLKGVGAAK